VALKESQNPNENRRQTMMKKSILYVVSAVLLGVALMVTPLYLFLTPSAIPQEFLSPEIYGFTRGRGLQEAVVRNELAYGVTPHFPADEISIGLMSVFSLAIAFVVFKQFKKRTV